jgi:hypothetical protein
MTVRGAVIAAVLAAPMLGGVTGPASAAWVVDASGKCVQRWSPDSLVRGPTAMLMAPTAPFRNAAGVFAYAPPPEPGTKAGVDFWQPVVAVLSGTAGVIDTGVWLGTGLADTVTGGYFGIAPYRATQLSLDPLIPPLMSDGQRRAIEAKRPDPCGRIGGGSS